MTAASQGREQVVAVTLNYNGGEHTLACLQSLADSDNPPGRIVVIDNASGDDSMACIRAAFPAIEVRLNPTNAGFGGGHNPLLQNLLETPTEWVWLINNDARVRADTLNRLLEKARCNPAAGVIGAAIIDPLLPDAPTTYGGGTVDLWLGRSRHCHELACAGQLDYITGACMLLRTAALRQVGLFDPDYFMYWEDVDLCFRLKQAGWTLEVAADAVVEHHHSATVGAASPLKDRMMNASAVRFFGHHGRLGGWPAVVVGVGARLF
ncbi:MAG: glycosyltransferase family 2 protein, partial [Xanthomonadaceae bacterium]|nr:glycosyltransferase family 2 protein [Xanthomonadaceae bacterium]